MAFPWIQGDSCNLLFGDVGKYSRALALNQGDFFAPLPSADVWQRLEMFLPRLVPDI